MSDFFSIPLIITLLTIIAVITTLAIYLSSRMKTGFYDKKKQVVQLDEMRAALEKQIYSLNERLLQNDERWKDVNHLLLRNELLNEKDSVFKGSSVAMNNFIKANGLVQADLLVDDKLIFVLTPFHDDHMEEFLAVREVCTSLGFKCVRGDESYFESDIFPQILRYIAKSKLIIANINGRNPNVMYELGIAHTLDKSVIHISEQPNNLPLDIKSKRFLIYQNLAELQTMLRKELLDIPKI